MKDKILLIVFFLIIGSTAWAEGTIDGFHQKAKGAKTSADMYVIKIPLTADASNGSFPPSTLTASQASDLIGYWLSHVKVDPGTIGPKDDSDITVKWGGVDILGGNGANIVDNAVEGYCTPKGTNVDAQWPMTGEVLTTEITGNTVNFAVVEVILVFDK